MTLLYLFFASMVGISKAVSDTLAYHYWDSVFKKWNFNSQFWDASISWKNKYANIEKNKLPKFLFSKTLLVFLTDGWHLFNLIRTLSFCGALVTMPYMDLWLNTEGVADKVVKAGVYWIAYFTSFHIFFTWVLVLKWPIIPTINKISDIMKKRLFPLILWICLMVVSCRKSEQYFIVGDTQTFTTIKTTEGAWQSVKINNYLENIPGGVSVPWNEVRGVQGQWILKVAFTLDNHDLNTVSQILIGDNVLHTVNIKNIGKSNKTLFFQINPKGEPIKIQALSDSCKMAFQLTFLE